MAMELKYPLFDGERLWQAASVTVDHGVITSVKECDPSQCADGFLMPGLIDAHTHMETLQQAEDMIQNGIVSTFDVNSDPNLIHSSDKLHIISSGGMAMGLVMDPEGFVERAVRNGAKYIKVLLFTPRSIGPRALRGIVTAAHRRGLKVAVHATEIKTVQQAADADADILLHVPMKEEYPAELAETIARKGIASAPTLVMMETFANSGRNGYQPEHFRNAMNAVKLLYDSGVQILTATDANSGSFAPAIGFGYTLHREMELLQQCGIPAADILAGATGKAATAFGVGSCGLIREGRSADLLLTEGRPDQNISDAAKIQHLWINGKCMI